MNRFWILQMSLLLQWQYHPLCIPLLAAYHIITIISYFFICCRSDCALLHMITHSYNSCPKIYALQKPKPSCVYICTKCYCMYQEWTILGVSWKSSVVPDSVLLATLTYLGCTMWKKNHPEVSLWNFDAVMSLIVCYSIFLVCDLSLKSHGIVFAQSLDGLNS